MIDSRETNRFTIQTASPSETEAFGVSFGEKTEAGLCVSLVGPLGSGKSVLARGICKGLGVDELVVSPSFILFEEYQGRLPVIHLDLYRLDHERELQELGVFDRMDDVVIVAEWGDRSPLLTDAADAVIRLEVTGESERAIEVIGSERCAAVVRGLFG